MADETDDKPPAPDLLEGTFAGFVRRAILQGTEIPGDGGIAFGLMRNFFDPLWDAIAKKDMVLMAQMEEAACAFLGFMISATPEVLLVERTTEHMLATLRWRQFFLKCAGDVAKPEPATKTEETQH